MAQLQIKAPGQCKSRQVLRTCLKGGGVLGLDEAEINSFLKNLQRVEVQLSEIHIRLQTRVRLNAQPTEFSYRHEGPRACLGDAGCSCLEGAWEQGPGNGATSVM